MRYLLKQLWPLVLLLAASIVIVIAVPSEASWSVPFRQYLFFAAYVIIVGAVVGKLGQFLPRGRFRYDRFPFKPYFWERDGKVYRDRLHIDRWKDKMTDMSKAGGKVEAKTATRNESSAGLLHTIQEMCVAETVHTVLICLGLSFFAFLRRWYALFFFVAYTLANLMDIIIMRYNRPRVVRLYERMREKEAKAAAKAEAAAAAAAAATATDAPAAAPALSAGEGEVGA